MFHMIYLKWTDNDPIDLDTASNTKNNRTDRLQMVTCYILQSSFGAFTILTTKLVQNYFTQCAIKKRFSKMFKSSGDRQSHKTLYAPR